VRLAAILLMLLLVPFLACVARAGEDEDDAADAEAAAVFNRLRAIDENIQRDADHPEAMGEQVDPGKAGGGGPGTQPDAEHVEPDTGDAASAGEVPAGTDQHGDTDEVTAPAPAPAPHIGAGSSAVLKPADTEKPAAGAPAKPGAAPARPAEARPATGMQSPIGTSPLSNPLTSPLASPPAGAPQSDDDS
jgi:hypothetical protein